MATTHTTPPPARQHSRLKLAAQCASSERFTFTRLTHPQCLYPYDEQINTMHNLQKQSQNYTHTQHTLHTTLSQHGSNLLPAATTHSAARTMDYISFVQTHTHAHTHAHTHTHTTHTIHTYDTHTHTHTLDIERLNAAPPGPLQVRLPCAIQMRCPRCVAP